MSEPIAEDISCVLYDAHERGHGEQAERVKDHIRRLGSAADKQPPTQVMESILDDVKVWAALRAKTDAEIAALLVEHVWESIPIGKPQSDLISEAIERLGRANGGPRQVEDDL